VLRLPVRLNWYRRVPPLRAGERWQLTVRLKAPHGLANPGGFDYERWLFARGFRATGYVRTDDGNRRCGAAPAFSVPGVRQQASLYLRQLDQPASQRALLRALAIGDRAGMSAQQWAMLRQTGTSHLLAISGLHVGLVAGLVFFAVERLWRRIGAARWFASPRAAALTAMLVSLLYALLSGFQVPAQRALIMVWAGMLSILLTGRLRAWPVLGLALWLVLLCEPLSVLGAGFWLSFGAVALIFYLTGGRHGRSGRLARTLVVQLGLVTGLTPLLWVWFQQASWVAAPANLVAIPWVGFLVVPVVLAGLLLIPISHAAADLMFTLAGVSVDGVATFLRLLDIGSLAQWPAPPLGPAGLTLSALGVLVLLLPAGTGLRILAALMLVPVVAVAPSRPAQGDVWMTLLDVGQGLAVVVESRRHVLVYDTGPAFPGGLDSGASVVVPFLRRRGYRSVDRLVISHGDNDHRGGGPSLSRAMPVFSLHSGEPQAVNWAYTRACRAEPAWQWDGVRFEYLTTGTAWQGNNASCVLKITAADGRSLLLPGDIEQAAENELLSSASARLRATVLVAPHHGSATSSSAGFLAAVDPSRVLFPTGYRNRFGFPAGAVTARYAAAGIRSLNTATAGAVEVRIEAGRQLHVEGWRASHRRLWHAPVRRGVPVS
jgi:competence protein ComEC